MQGTRMITNQAAKSKDTLWHCGKSTWYSGADLVASAVLFRRIWDRVNGLDRCITEPLQPRVGLPAVGLQGHYGVVHDGPSLRGWNGVVIAGSSPERHQKQIGECHAKISKTVFCPALRMSPSLSSRRSNHAVMKSSWGSAGLMTDIFSGGSWVANTFRDRP